VRHLQCFLLVDEKRAGRGAVRLADEFLAEIRIGAGQQMLAGIALVARAGFRQCAVRSHAVGVGHGLPRCEINSSLAPLIPAFQAGSEAKREIVVNTPIAGPVLAASGYVLIQDLSTALPLRFAGGWSLAPSISYQSKEVANSVLLWSTLWTKICRPETKPA
jgi:hypothetical protein